MIEEVFGPQVVAAPRYRLVAELSVQLIRGLALSGLLYREPKECEPLVDQWAAAARLLLADPARAAEQFMSLDMSLSTS
jgi:hypothetical protein